jgi:hypothetical protein
LQDVLSDLPRHGECLRPFRRLADGDESQRAFLTNHFAGIGNPRRRAETGEFHIDPECRDWHVAAANDLAGADRHRDRRILERGGIEHHPLML